MTLRTQFKSLSRRRFLQSAAALATTRSVPGIAQGLAARPARTLAYVGTYTGKDGNGEGIYVLAAHPETGELSNRRLVARTPNPSWIAIHPSLKYLYAVNEVASFHGNSGSVSAFAIETITGDLRPLNTVSSDGAGPAYMSLDASGRFLFVANYGGGSIAVLPIRSDGSLGIAVDVHRDEGSIGSKRATSAPPGSFAISGHDTPHAHMIAPDPQGKFVLATDLAQDRIYVYRFNAATGKLTPPEHQPFVALPSGDGPRHFAFHPDGHWLYSLQEEASTIVFFTYDAASGTLHPQQTISSLPPGFAGTSFASEILIDPDGKTLYAANRLHDTIAVFTIRTNGTLTYTGECSTLGDYPVQLRLSPDTAFLYACNRRSDAITCFRRNHTSGRLSFTGQFTPVGSPASITFVSL